MPPGERYWEIIESLNEFHRLDPLHIPDPHAAMSFDGDSFQEKVVEICVSHNEDAGVLLDRNPTNIDQWRFPERYPIGCCLADVRLTGATLRLADILDFDRERTPAVLFYYLLPRSADPAENVSVREWSKHLSISNWELEQEKIIFRGRSPSAIIHHSIIEFCKTIEDEISRVHSTYENNVWPFMLKPRVETAIEAAGYRYIPYRFSLDEDRIYSLLMGRSIYDEPLAALRELIQNSVDACLLRDSLTRYYDSSIILPKTNRIIVEYVEQDTKQGRAPVLRVTDSGIGISRIPSFLTPT
jgi:molecular chaperone HtpG